MSQSDPAPAALVRPEFVARMEAELRANARKGDWREWHPDMDSAFKELQHHVGKLAFALTLGDNFKIAELSADVANIAMKIHEEFG